MSHDMFTSSSMTVVVSVRSQEVTSPTRTQKNRSLDLGSIHQHRKWMTRHACPTKLGGFKVSHGHLIFMLELLLKSWTYQHEIGLIHVFSSRFQRPHSSWSSVVGDASRGGDASSSVHLAGNENRHVSTPELSRIISTFVGGGY